ncbi:MAG: threonine/serine exporter family protein [Bacillaceae bacterium]|nr:threonine/serine exporter family protein [Bacillaceae bacterium]
MDNQPKKIMDVCLLAGKIMLQNGAETYRVEDTMMRIADAFGIRDSHSFVTPTGIIFSLDGTDPTRMVRILERSTDLHKVTQVNSISRQISREELTVDEAYDRLKRVESGHDAYPVLIQIAAASIASGCFLIMFQGRWHDFIPAVVSGGFGFASMLYFHRLIQVRFFSEFLASFVIGLMSYLLVTSGIGHELDKIIIGSVMPLVPGVLITNAVRDLMAGHLVAGLSRGAEAFLTATAIGTGIAVVISIF